MTFDPHAGNVELPVIDLELESLLTALPFREPSRRLDARVAAAAHFAGRPMLTRMRWPASVAALMALATGLALGWSMRDAAPSNWIPEGTEWQAAGFSPLGSKRMSDGQVVRAAGTVYVRTDRYRDPANGAVIKIQYREPRYLIGRPNVD